jgi:hypothetical protein
MCGAAHGHVHVHVHAPAGARLARLLPRSRRVMLPDSGHAALLERGMDLATIMRGAGLTAKPRSSKPAAAAAAAAAATLPQQQQQPAGSTAVTAPSEEMVQVRLPGGSSGSSDGSSRRAKGSMPRIIGVVKDDKALPGSTGRDGTPSPRPATVMPRTNKVKPAAVAAATAASSSSSDSDAEAPRYTPVAAAGAAAAMAAATVATGGGAAATAADAGSSSSSSGVLQPAVSSNGSSRGSSPTGPQQQQQQGSAADKDLAWDEWSQILAPWRVSEAKCTGLTSFLNPEPEPSSNNGLCLQTAALTWPDLEFGHVVCYPGLSRLRGCYKTTGSLCPMGC